MPVPPKPLDSPFFEVGKTYRHDSPHGSEGVFTVEFVGRAPDGFEHYAETGGVAFGWKKSIDLHGKEEPNGSYETPDFAGWEEINE